MIKISEKRNPSRKNWTKLVTTGLFLKEYIKHMNLKSIVRHRINKPNTVVSRNYIEQNLNIALGNFATTYVFYQGKIQSDHY